MDELYRLRKIALKLQIENIRWLHPELSDDRVHDLIDFSVTETLDLMDIMDTIEFLENDNNEIMIKKLSENID